MNKQWCIPPSQNGEFVARMEDILEVYRLPYDPNHPMICMDEQPYQFLGETSDRIRERENGLLPVVVIDKDLSNRMASTIRHNRARGTHSIDLMVNIVSDLRSSGMGDDWIRKHIGMDEDELLRLKQISGIAALFKDREFGPAWEPERGGDG